MLLIIGPGPGANWIRPGFGVDSGRVRDGIGSGRWFGRANGAHAEPFAGVMVGARLWYDTAILRRGPGVAGLKAGNV